MAREREEHLSVAQYELRLAREVRKFIFIVFSSLLISMGVSVSFREREEHLSVAQYELRLAREVI